MNKNKLTKLDYVAGGLLWVFCYFVFLHGDIWGVGLDSLSYLFGGFLDFYDNTLKLDSKPGRPFCANYPPTLYFIVAMWLYPAKVLGLLTSPAVLPGYLCYWIKVLTTLVYVFSGWVFYKIARVYAKDRVWARFAAIVWLATPIALFSQLIFSQYDIFYVTLTLIGFLFFLRRHLAAASLVFGIAITFKYFPAFVYLPLLLLFEKRLLKLGLLLFVFAAPTLLVHLLYDGSPGYIEAGIINAGITDRVYAAKIDIGFCWQLYYLFILFTILCGLSYLAETSEERIPRVAAYLYMVSAMLPYPFMSWHPQWGIFFMPAIVLTSMIDRNYKRFLLLDLFGMACFVAMVSLAFINNVDTAMIKVNYLFGLDLPDHHKMADLFRFFGDQSPYVFLSALMGYLLIQVIAKYQPLLQAPKAFVPERSSIDYNQVRARFFVGLLIFVVPATIAWTQSQIDPRVYVEHEQPVSFPGSTNPGELTQGRTFEQTIVAHGAALIEVDLYLATYTRPNSGNLDVEVLDSSNQSIAKVELSMGDLKDNSWVFVKFPSVPMVKGQSYKLRLTSPDGKPGNAITWWEGSNSAMPGYDEGTAIIDGAPQPVDFAFRLVFLKNR